MSRSRNDCRIGSHCALITLHALGRLEEVAQYFGKILIPAAYLGKVLSEKSNLIPHQLSQRVSLERLKSAIDNGRITVLADEDRLSGTAIPVVDEYRRSLSEDEHRFAIVDLIEPMYTLGWLTEGEYDRTRDLFDPVRSRYSTPDAASVFTGVDRAPDLDHAESSQLPRTGDRRVSHQDRRRRSPEINRGLSVFRFQEEVRHRHSDLWERVQSDERSSFFPRRYLYTCESRLPHTVPSWAFRSAPLLAEQHDMPLIADDRVIRVCKNERPARECVASGTDCVLEKLGEAGTLTSDEVADSILQLMSGISLHPAVT